MTAWLWECFDTYLNGSQFEVTESGPVVGPVRELSIKRLDNGELELILTTPGRGNLKDLNNVPGTMRTLTDEIGFSGLSGDRALARAVHRGDRFNHSDPVGGPQHVEHYYVGQIEITRSDPPPVAHTIDWLYNVDRYSCHWFGGSIFHDREIVETRTIGKKDSGVTLKGSGAGGQMGAYSAALEMVIGGVRLFVCASEEGPKDRWPGYILYEGAPDEAFRQRVREVVGFTLGSGLIWLGTTALDAESQFVWTLARSAYPYGRDFVGACDPPAPLSHRMDDAIDEDGVGRVASALFDHYEALDFRALSWNYWFAVSAPGHMAAGHFGAAIEALEDAYRKANPDFKPAGPIRAAAVEDRVKQALRSAIDELSLDEDVAEHLRNRIGHINQPSGASARQQLFDRLGLEWGPAERGAWKRRNEAAHGKARRPGDSIPTARDTVILRTILNRMVLKIASASHTYIDRYTPGYKVRALSQPIDVETTDGTAPS